MKRLVIALVLVSGFTAIAFAAFDSTTSTKKVKAEKKAEKKRECKHTCMYGI